MATYPTGVYAPASKSAGQTIQASFFNDPDAEITAVEDALKNGIPHAVTIAGALTVSTGGVTVSTGSVNIAGPSSLATLQVNGGSTFVGTVAMSSNLVVAGHSTIAGDLNVGGNITAGGVAIVGRAPSAKLSLQNNMTVGTGAWLGVAWTAEEYDSTGLHSTAANSSRLLITSSGLWLVGGQVDWAFGSNPSTNQAGLKILANDNEAIVGQESLVGAQTAWTQSVSGVFLATSTTQYITLQVRQTSGGNGTAIGSTGSGNGPTHLWAQRMSI